MITLVETLQHRYGIVNCRAGTAFQVHKLLIPLCITMHRTAFFSFRNLQAIEGELLFCSSIPSWQNASCSHQLN